MQHPNTRIKLKTEENFTIIFSEYVRTWKEYHRVLRRFREVMEESVADLYVEVGA